MLRRMAEGDRDRRKVEEVKEAEAKVRAVVCDSRAFDGYVPVRRAVGILDGLILGW